MGADVVTLTWYVLNKAFLTCVDTMETGLEKGEERCISIFYVSVLLCMKPNMRVMGPTGGSASLKYALGGAGGMCSGLMTFLTLRRCLISGGVIRWQLGTGFGLVSAPYW